MELLPEVSSAKIIIVILIFCYGSNTLSKVCTEEPDYSYTEINPDELNDNSATTTASIKVQYNFDGTSQPAPIVLSSSERIAFNQWKTYFNRSDISDKNLQAALNFLNNDKRIKKFNSRNVSYKQSHNKYSDQNFEQHKTRRTGLKFPPNVASKSVSNQKFVGAVDPPRYVNHRRKMGPVKDQRECGACYAFAATSVAEFTYRSRVVNPKKYILSEQDIVDCDILSFGCQVSCFQS